MAHDALKPYLTEAPGRSFVTSITHKIYKWSEKIPSQYYRYRVLDEFAIRYETGEVTRLGLDKNKLYRIDAVIFVEPGYRALNQGQTYTIGLEIKGSIVDLRQDDKMEAYIGWVDYFFIAVDGRVPGFVDEALNRAGGNPLIGVMDIVTGKIHKMPGRSQVPTDNYVKLLQNALYHYLFDDSKTTIVNIDTVPMDTTPIEAAPIESAPAHGVDEDMTEVAHEGTAMEPIIGQTGQKERIERTYRREDAAEFRKTQSELIQVALEGVDPTAQKVYEAISGGAEKTAQIAEEVGISTSAVANATAALKKAGLVGRLGGCRNASYVPTAPDPKAKYRGKCLKCELYKESMKESCEDCPNQN